MKKKWRKFSARGRGQSILAAVMAGQCVECRRTLVEVNLHHLRCPVCGWEVQIERSCPLYAKTG